MTADAAKESYRQIRKAVEEYLHPYPIFDGIEIRHRHSRLQLIFTAWDLVEDKRINDRYLLQGCKNIFRSKVPLTSENLIWLLSRN